MRLFLARLAGLVGLAALAVGSATAQTTTVTGTITDANSNPYYPGTVAAQMVLNSGQAPPAGSIPFTSPTATSVGGMFSIVLTSGQSYVVTMCAMPVNIGPTANPTPTQVCFSSPPIPIAGVSQVISSSLNPIAAQLGPFNQTGAVLSVGANGDVQTKSGAGFAGGTQLTSLGKLTNDNTWTNNSRIKGPIPWRDFTAYQPAGGCSTTASGLGANATGTMAGLSTALSLSTASDFKTGCGVAVLKAGPAPTLNTPPSLMASPTLARVGSSTVTVTIAGGHGLAVGSGTGFNQGVVVSSCSIGAYNGTWPIQTVADATHFTYTVNSSGTDSPTSCVVNTSFGYAHGTVGLTTYNYKVCSVDANMGVSACSTTPIQITTGNATLSKYNYNHIMWPVVTGAYEFLVYSDNGLGGALTCVGTAFTNGYSDRGFAMPCPPFAPVNPIASMQSGTLNTTIVSGGGTTTLVLAAAANATGVTSQNVYHDESSFLTSCVNDVISYLTAAGTINANEEGCLIPSGAWNFNGMMPTGTVSTSNHTVKIQVAGSVLLQTVPWFVAKAGYSIVANGTGPNTSSFQSRAGVTVYSTTPVAAGFVVNAGSTEISGFQLNNQAGGYGIYVVSGAALQFDNDAISNGGHAGSPIAFDNGILGVRINNMNLNGGGNSGDPADILVSPTPYWSTATCCVYVNNLVSYNHSIEISGPGGNGSGGASHNSFFFSNWLQENLAPADGGDITLDSGPNATNSTTGATGTESINGIAIQNLNDSDVSGTSVFVAAGSQFGVNGVSLQNINGPNSYIQCVGGSTFCATSNPVSVPGMSVNGVGVSTGLPQMMPQLNVINSYGILANAPFNVTDTSYGGRTQGFGMLLPGLNAFSVTGTGAGSLAAGTWCVQVAPVDAAGRIGLPTNPLCQVVGASSSISYQWSEGTHFTSSNFAFYYCTTGGSSCTPNNEQLTGAIFASPVTYTFTAAGGSPASPNVQNKAYLTWLPWDFDDPNAACFYCGKFLLDDYPVGFGVKPTKSAGISVQAALGFLTGTQYQAVETTAPTGVVNADQLYADSTAHRWKMLNNNGGSLTVASLIEVPQVLNHSGTIQSVPHIVVDSCTLGTSCAVTLTGAAVFTSTTSYSCIPEDTTTPGTAATCTKSSGSALAITGTGTDTIQYTLVGN